MQAHFKGQLINRFLETPFPGGRYMEEMPNQNNEIES